MPSYTGNWQHAAAIVLVFSPPGLLLITAWLRLRNIPYSQTTALLEDWLLLMSGTQGVFEIPKRRMTGRSKTEDFLQQLSQTIDQQRRRGHDSKRRIESLLTSISKRQNKSQALLGQLSHIAFKTFLALFFCQIIPYFLNHLKLGANETAGSSQTLWITMIAASSLTTAGIIPVYWRITKTSILLDFREPADWTSWQKWLVHGTPLIAEDGNSRLSNATRMGINPESAQIRSMDRNAQRAVQKIDDAIDSIKKRLVIFELTTLLPASTMVILARLQ